MTRRCRRCQRERRVGKEISACGIPTCHACTAERERERERQSWLAKPLAPCCRCGGPKPRGKGRRLCDDCRIRRWHCRFCGEEVPRGFRTCRECKRQQKLAASKRWNAAHPEVMRATRARWEAANPEASREAKRAWYQRLKADREAYAAYLENRRLDWRLRAERNGHPIPPVPEERYPAASSQWTIPADPIRKLIQEWLSEGGEKETLARRAGVSPRLVYRLVEEGSEGISVAAADRIAVALGLHLDLIYEGAA